MSISHAFSDYPIHARNLIYLALRNAYIETVEDNVRYAL